MTYDIAKYQPLDPDIVQISSTLLIKCVELKLKKGTDYLTLGKRDAIALAKHFRLTAHDVYGQ